MNTKRIPIFLSLMFIVCVGLVYLIGSFRPLASDKFANPAPAVNAPPSPFLTDQVVIAPTTRATSALSAPRTAVSIAQAPATATAQPTSQANSQTAPVENTQPTFAAITQAPPPFVFQPTRVAVAQAAYTFTPSSTSSPLPTRLSTSVPYAAQTEGAPTEYAPFDVESGAATLTSIPAQKTFDAIATRALSTPVPNNQNSARAIDKSTNYLLIGTDTRTDDPNWKPNTDVMMVLFLDTMHQRAALLSLPRDLVVAIPGHQAFRINSAYHSGWEQNSVAGGVAILKEALQNDFDIRVDHWALIDFDGLAKLIDTLGGIEVNVSCPLSDTIDEQAFTIPAGRVQMDYLTAKRYVQSRYTTSDTSRNYRQQRVVWAMAKKALVLNAPDRIPAMYDLLKDSIATDMNLFDMVGLIPAVYQLDLQNHPEHLHARVLEAPDVYPWVSPNGAWLYMPNYDEINKTLDTMFDAPQVALDQPTATECPLRASTPPPTDAPTPVAAPTTDNLTPTPQPPSTQVSPTEVPTPEVPPTGVPPTAAPTLEASPTEVLPTEAPTLEVPPTDVSPPEEPTVEAPPTDVPQPTAEFTPTPLPVPPESPTIEAPAEAPTAANGG